MTPEQQLREALEKCRNQFAFYAADAYKQAIETLSATRAEFVTLPRLEG